MGPDTPKASGETQKKSPFKKLHTYVVGLITHESSESSRSRQRSVRHSVPGRPEVPTHLTHKRETCVGRSSPCHLFVSLFFKIITFNSPAQLVGGFTLSDLLDKPWSQVSSLLHPGTYVLSIFIAHRVQNSHCSSIFHRMLLTHALALSASQFFMHNQFACKKKSLRVCPHLFFFCNFRLFSGTKSDFRLHGPDHIKTGNQAQLQLSVSCEVTRWSQRVSPCRSAYQASPWCYDSLSSAPQVGENQLYYSQSRDDIWGSRLSHFMIIPNTKRHPNTKTDQLPIFLVNTGLPRPYHNTSPP